MRIVAGKHRGRKLASFGGTDIRPTPDRVKESLFQILSEKIAGARVLDLFAGSGALGLECLSRGAAEVHFNDAGKESCAVVKKNLAALREEGRVTTLDFRACLAQQRGQFDLIFADPPYREEYLSELCAAVLQKDLLADGGLIVYESETEQFTPAGFALADGRSYGRTRVNLYCRAESGQERRHIP